MAVDELEVLLNLDLGPLEDKVDDAIDEVGRLDGKSTDNLEEDFEDTADAADDLTESMRDADDQTVRADVDGSEVTQLQRRLSALDGRSVEINADVDRDRLRGALSGGGGGRSAGGIFGGNRLPGELDEVQEGFMALSAVPPQIKALAAAGTAAAAALGAGAGLAGVATKLAAELGPQGLQSDVQGARATLKETGREFASAFSGVIRSEVLPAVRGLAGVIQTIDDELATFSGAMLDLLKNIQGVGPFIGAVVGAGRAAGESQSNADALAQGVGNVPGIREITRTMTQAIQRVRGRFKRDLIPREDMLEQIKGLRLDAVKQLQKLKQQVPGAFPPDLISAFAAQLKRVKKQLKDIRTISGAELKQATLQPADASQVDPAGQASPQTGEGVGSKIPLNIKGITNATRRMEILKQKLQAVRRQLKQGKSAADRMSASIKRIGLSSLAQGFTQIGKAIAGTENMLKKFQKIIGKTIQRMGRVLLIRGILTGNPIAALGGAAALIGGGAISSLDSGGRILSDGIAKVHKGEQVVPADVVSRMSAATKPEAIMPDFAANVSAAVSGQTIGVQQAGSAKARMAAGTLSVDIPVEAVADANRAGTRRKRRTGRQ